MNTKSSVVLCAAAVALTLMPAVAQADTFVSPFVGVAFGGDMDKAKPTFGGSLVLMGRGAGLELEVGLTPSLSDDEAAKASLTTLGVSYVAGGDVRGRSTKPYAVAGLVLLRTKVEDVDHGTENNVALNLGAGLIALFNDTIGVRGDVRYFRQLKAPSDTPLIPVADKFDFWRAIAAVSFRF